MRSRDSVLEQCFRAKQAGFNVIYNPETQIIHYKGESVKSAPFDMIQVFYSAMHQFYHKYSDQFASLIFLEIVVSLGISFRKTIAYFKNQNVPKQIVFTKKFLK